jgi:hypothetical protein
MVTALVKFSADVTPSFANSVAADVFPPGAPEGKNESAYLGPAL